MERRSQIPRGPWQESSRRAGGPGARGHQGQGRPPRALLGAGCCPQPPRLPHGPETLRAVNSARIEVTQEGRLRIGDQGLGPALPGLQPALGKAWPPAVPPSPAHQELQVALRVSASPGASTRPRPSSLNEIPNRNTVPSPGCWRSPQGTQGWEWTRPPSGPVLASQLLTSPGLGFRLHKTGPANPCPHTQVPARIQRDAKWTGGDSCRGCDAVPSMFPLQPQNAGGPPDGRVARAEAEQLGSGHLAEGGHARPVCGLRSAAARGLRDSGGPRGQTQ